MTNEEREKTIATAIDVFEYQIERSEDVKCHKCDECGENPFEDYCIKDVAKWLRLALEALKQEPREHGEWIRVDDTKVKCSKCEITHFIAQYPHGKVDFCPNCGADMRKEQK